MSKHLTLFFIFGSVACGPSARSFKLAFVPVAGSVAMSCVDTITGFGPDGNHAVSMSDLRLYVSNVRFYDASGKEVAATFDSDEFQVADGKNTVTLIDLTSNTEGSCAENAIAFGEGTARTHAALTGKTIVDAVTRVTFDVGIPAAVMGDVIANNTLEGAPSPFGEMYWSWAGGYRYFVFNFVVKDGTGTAGEGYVHVGSRDCGSMGAKALSDRERCGFANMPAVALTGINLDKNQVAINLGALLANVDFRAPVYDPVSFAEVGETVGVACHSSPAQPHCTSIFSALGVSMSDGTSDAAADDVFRVR